MAVLRDILLKLCRREDLTRDEAPVRLRPCHGRRGDRRPGRRAAGRPGRQGVDRRRAGRGGGGHAGPVGPRARPRPAVVLDTCGTGGDVKGTFNISTAAAIIAAAAGVTVVKHGNRSASGKSGSADVLEALGVRPGRPADAERCLAAANICFAFARSHHPAMRHVAAARSSLGVPTLFNVLGPLTNPAGARHQLLGVFAPELTERMAAVLRELGSERAWVVHADDGLDEISTMGPTRVTRAAGRPRRHLAAGPGRPGRDPAPLADLQVDASPPPPPRCGPCWPASRGRCGTSPCSTPPPRWSSPAGPRALPAARSRWRPRRSTPAGRRRTLAQLAAASTPAGRATPPRRPPVRAGFLRAAVYTRPTPGPRRDIRPPHATTIPPSVAAPRSRSFASAEPNATSAGCNPTGSPRVPRVAVPAGRVRPFDGETAPWRRQATRWPRSSTASWT